MVETSLLVAIIAGVVTAAGWLVSAGLAYLASRRRQHVLSQIERTERQLAELYGPLTFLIKENKRVFQDLLEILGRPYVWGPDVLYLPQGELDTWLFWVEHAFIPTNREIRDLLRSHTHLIEGAAMPQPFVHFIEHFSSWDIRHSRWRLHQQQYSWRSGINWPADFSETVTDTFATLKKQHAKLIGQL